MSQMIPFLSGRTTCRLTLRAVLALVTAGCIVGALPATAGASVTVTLQVQSSQDDYNESSQGHSQSTDSQWDLWNTTDLKVAYRFVNVPMPRDATILSAVLQVYTNTTLLTANIHGTAQGEASGNAPARTGADLEITNAPKTAAAITIENLPAWTNLTFNTVADVTAVVQEIVDRSDFAYGNALKIFLLSTSTATERRARTYDDAPSHGAKLIVTYERACPDRPAKPCPDTLDFVPHDTLDSFDTGWTGNLHNGPSFAADSKLALTVSGCTGGNGVSCGVCNLSGPVRSATSGIQSQRCFNASEVECTDDSPCLRQCVGGTNDGAPCSATSSCQSGKCQGQCVGGSNAGAGCSDSSGCPGGTCGAGKCMTFFGSPVPLENFGVPLCITNVVRDTITGTIDTASGQSSVDIPIRTYLGTQGTNCGLCQGDADRNDGLRQGTCSGGVRNGRPCDANGRSFATLGETSFDCPVDITTLGRSLVSDLLSQTASVTRTLTTSNPACSASGTTGRRCFCDTCDDAAATPCFTNADCVAVGGAVCGSKRCSGGANVNAACTVNSQCPGAGCQTFGQPTKPNICSNFDECVSGACPINEGTFFCGPSAPYRHCTANADCTSFKTCDGGIRAHETCVANGDCPGSVCVTDSCALTLQSCYDTGTVNDTVTAIGNVTTVATYDWDATFPALGCAGPDPAHTDAANLANLFIGLPGLARIELPMHVSAPDPIQDLVFANHDAPNRLCQGNGSGGFTCSNIDSGVHVSEDVAVGDLDGDGDLDLVFANNGANANTRCLNNGGGSFSCAAIDSDTGNRSTDVAAGDFNGDGNVDVVFSRISGQRNRVCLGNGTGGFTCSDVSTDVGDSFGVTVGDFNGDNELDVVFARGGGPHNRVCLGNGTGAFTCSDVSTDAQDSSAVAAADVNHDGKLDLVFANTERIPPAGFHNRVCLGNGTGGFTCSNVSSDSFRSVGVALTDLNGDGNIDAVFANYNQQRNRVCLGNGAGAFTCSDAGTDQFASADVVIADFNGDCAPDIVFADSSTASSEKSRICINSGIGALTCQNVSSDVIETGGVAVGSF